MNKIFEELQLFIEIVMHDLIIEMALTITSIVYGYYVYKHIWEAEFSAELPCSSGPGNHQDHYVMEIL